MRERLATIGLALFQLIVNNREGSPSFLCREAYKAGFPRPWDYGLIMRMINCILALSVFEHLPTGEMGGQPQGHAQVRRLRI
jgi:hypothetical protein